MVSGPHLLVKLMNLVTRLSVGSEDWKPKTHLALLSVMDKYESMTTLTAITVVSECCLLLPETSRDNKHFARIVTYAEKLLKSRWANYNKTGLKILSKLITFNKGIISSSQRLIVSALNSTDESISEQAMSLIIQLVTPANIQSVFELSSVVSTGSKSKTINLRQSLDILTSCSLKELEIEWFAQSLLKLWELHSNRGVRSADVDIPLSHLLTYISSSEISGCVEDLATALRKTWTSDTPSLFAITLQMWIRVCHKDLFTTSDNDLSSLIELACQHVATNYRCIIAVFLTCIHSLQLQKQLLLSNDHYVAISSMVREAGGEIDLCYLLEAIKEMMGSVGEMTYSTSVGELLSDLESYSSSQTVKKKCREVDSRQRFVPPASSILKFSEQVPNVAVSEISDTMLRSTRTAWTNQGTVQLNPILDNCQE